MADADRFVGGDLRYLREQQYRDRSRLSARASLHAKYGTAATAWFPWLAAQVTWPAGARVLDVGCGPGWLWIEAGPHLPPRLEVTLTDLSTGMVIDARRRIRHGHVGRLAGAVADAQALPFGDGHFDVVVANHMLYHVPDPAQAVAELVRVLRPGGSLMATTNGGAHLRELCDILVEVFGVDPGHAVIESFGVEVAAPILRSFFDTVEWRPYADTLVCTDPVDVLAFMCSMPPGEDATEAERGELAARVADVFGRGGGTLRLTKETGVFLCGEPVRAGVDATLR